MSWGTCYKGSNNIHFNFPPLMNDSRNVSNYKPGSLLDENLKKQAYIVTTSDYRLYLQKNANNIIKNNQLNACDECNHCSFNINEQGPNGSPYIFDSILSNDQPYGYENSDLKNVYLSRQQLDAKLQAPRFILKPTN